MTESVSPSRCSFQVPEDVLQGREFIVVSDRRPVGVFPVPDVSSAPVTYLKPREVVATSGYHLDALDGRIYLQLTDGRGWAARCSRKDPTKLALLNTSLAMDVAALDSAGRALLIASKKRRIVMTRRCLGSGRGPVVPRARRKQSIGGPLHGATVQAEFRRARQCARGYVVCPLFFLPGEEHAVRGAGATRRLRQMASLWAALVVETKAQQGSRSPGWERALTCACTRAPAYFPRYTKSTVSTIHGGVQLHSKTTEQSRANEEQPPLSSLGQF